MEWSIGGRQDDPRNAHHKNKELSGIRSMMKTVPRSKSHSSMDDGASCASNISDLSLASASTYMLVPASEAPASEARVVEASKAALFGEVGGGGENKDEDYIADDEEQGEEGERWVEANTLEWQEIDAEENVGYVPPHAKPAPSDEWNLDQLIFAPDDDDNSIATLSSCAVTSDLIAKTAGSVASSAVSYAQRDTASSYEEGLWLKSRRKAARGEAPEPVHASESAKAQLLWSLIERRSAVRISLGEIAAALELAGMPAPPLGALEKIANLCIGEEQGDAITGLRPERDMEHGGGRLLTKSHFIVLSRVGLM